MILLFLLITNENMQTKGASLSTLTINILIKMISFYQQHLFNGTKQNIFISDALHSDVCVHKIYSATPHVLLHKFSAWNLIFRHTPFCEVAS